MAYAIEELHGLTEAHRKSVESPSAEMAAHLEDALGRKLVAYITGVSDPKAVGRWANGERSPSAENEKRLQAAYYIFWLLARGEGPHTIRAWFAGMNPLLDDEAPATVIREGQLREALAAAKAFVSPA